MNNITRHTRKNETSSHRNYKYRRLSSIENGACSRISDDEDEIFPADNFELKKYNNQSKSTDPTRSPSKLIPEYEQIIERPIKKGETLRSIALKYRISLFELKRINKLHQETEFFALNSVKIPIKPNSVLNEILAREAQNNENDNVNNTDSTALARESVLGIRSMSSCSDNESDVDIHVGIISINQILREKKTRKEARRFLENMRNDLINIREKTKTYKDSLDEATDTLTTVHFHPIRNETKYWDISSWKLILLACIIIGVPILMLILVYINEK